MEMSIKSFSDHFISKMFGYVDANDYHHKAACVWRIPKIAIPTLFINALDDPIIGSEGIDYEVIAANPNTALATSEHGGHMSYNTWFFSEAQWFY